DFTLASGRESTVKFDFDRVKTNSGLYVAAVAGLARCIKANMNFDEYDTVALVSVATGANRLGDSLTNLRLPVFHVPSRKDYDGNFYISERTDGIVGILVDDVYTTGSSFEKVRRVFRGEIIGAYALLDRSGMTDPTLAGGVPVRSVMQYEL
ncbi:hypothetical protein KDA23_05515, partial [Candidatus Saccharibacteria bacterium]|nr:hypothetical protein [Candidatus Saccharibacteria bacterium]